MKRGTASRVILGKNTIAEMPGGVFVGTDVILGKKDGLTNDFNGLVLSNTVMLGKKVSHAAIISVIVRGADRIVLPDAIANSLSYVKAFGGTEQRSIPAEYTQLAYIGSSGTQYIDLGYKGNGNTKVDIKFKYHTASTAVGSGRVFGSRISATSNAFAVGTSSGVVYEVTNRLFWSYDNQPYFASDENFSRNVWKTVVFSATEHRIDGVSAGNDYEIVEFETPQNLKLFGFDNNGSMGVGYVDVAYCKLWDNGVLVRDLIPAKRNSDNVLGMYDTVTGNFLTNAGTGTFTAGAAATPTPDAPMDIVSNNGVLKHSANMANVNAQTALVGYYISASGVVTASTQNWFYQDYIPVEPNTTYTLTTSSPIYFISISEYSTADDSGFIVRDVSGGGSYTTLTITTSANTHFVRFGANIDGSSSVTLERVLAINWMLNKGNSMPYTPYVEGGVYTDGTVETIGVHGKNLFDRDTVDQNFVSGKIKNNNGEEINDGTSSYSTTYIKVSPSTSYTFSWIGGTAVIQRIYYYTENKQWISRTQNTFGPSPVIFTTPDNCEYIQVQRQNTVYIAATNIQLELGSTATEYAPYFNGGTATAEMLLKVGDYQDVQSILDGVVTRNVGVKVLDGTEDWTYSSSRFRLNISDYLVGSSIMATTISHYDLPAINTGAIANGEARFGKVGADSAVSNSNMFIIHDDNYTDLDSYKAWLSAQYAAGTPVIVLYPLATPTTESVAGQTLQVTDGDNVLEITQASIDGLELEAQYNTLVQLTVQEVESANLDNDVTVTIL